MDFATIGVRVVEDGIDPTITKLKTLGTSGQEAASKFNAAFQQSAATAADFARAGANAAQIAQLTGMSMTQAREAAARYGGQLAETMGEAQGLALAEREMAIAGMQAAAAHEAAGRAAGMHGLQLGRLDAELGTFLGRMAGVNTATTRLGATLGANVIGFGNMAVGLVAISGLLWVFEKLTGDTDEAAKAQKEATKALKDWYDTQQAGVGGKFANELASNVEQLGKMRQQLEQLKRMTTSPGLAAGSEEALAGANPFLGLKNAELQRQYDERARIVEAGEKHINDLITKAINDQASQRINDLATLIKYDQATAEERARAAAQLADYQQQLSNAIRNGLSEEDRVRLIKWIETLQSALSDLPLQRLTALNQAFGESALTIKLLEIHYDALAHKTSDAMETQQRLAAVLSANTEAIKAAEEAMQRYADDTITDTNGKTIVLLDTFTKLGIQLSNLQPKLTPNTTQAFAATIGQQLAGVQYGIPTAALPKPEDTHKTTLELQAQARAIEQAVTGAIQLGEAFGFVSRNVGDIVRGLGQVVAGIGPLKAAMDAYRAAEDVKAGSGSTASVIAAALPVAGGIASVLHGIVDSINSQKEAADQLKRAAEALHNSITSFANIGNTLADQIAAVSAQAGGLRNSVYDTYAGAIRGGSASAAQAAEDAYNRINDAEAKRIQLLQQEDAALRKSFTESLAVRNLEAAGLHDQAVALQQAIDDQKELTDAIKQYGATSAEVQSLIATQNAEAQARADAAAWAKEAQQLQDIYDAQQRQIQAEQEDQQRAEAQRQKQIQIAQDQLSVQRTALQAQQTTVDGLQKTVDLLRGYSDSLKLSKLTVLSPVLQYQEAKRQYDLVAAQAAAGDQGAVANLPNAANAFLEQSRAMFASTDRYAQDYAQVQAFVGAITDQFGTQLTTQEKMLAEMQKQTDLLQQQVNLWTGGPVTAAQPFVPPDLSRWASSDFDPSAVQWNSLLQGGVTGLENAPYQLLQGLGPTIGAAEWQGAPPDVMALLQANDPQDAMALWISERNNGITSLQNGGTSAGNGQIVPTLQSINAKMGALLAATVSQTSTIRQTKAALYP